MRHDTSCVSLASSILLVASGVTVSTRMSGGAPLMPMAISSEDTIRHRWLEKPVMTARLLENMENLSNWSHSGFAGPAGTVPQAGRVGPGPQPVLPEHDVR